MVFNHWNGYLTFKMNEKKNSLNDTFHMTHDVDEADAAVILRGQCSKLMDNVNHRQKYVFGKAVQCMRMHTIYCLVGNVAI